MTDKIWVVYEAIDTLDYEYLEVRGIFDSLSKAKATFPKCVFEKNADGSFSAPAFDHSHTYSIEPYTMNCFISGMIET